MAMGHLVGGSFNNLGKIQELFTYSIDMFGVKMSTKQVSVKILYLIFELYSIRNMLSQNELSNRLTEQSSLECIPFLL